jgi:hypothetical protein
MTDPADEWGFSNPGPGTILLWLEPWADELELPAKSTVLFSARNGSQSCAPGELEWTEDHLILWATAQTVAVSIDGVFQHTGSAVIPIPDGLTKDTLRVLFGNQPAARLGGATVTTENRTSWWQRAGRRLGL